ncbi:hypothetical protein [Bartonella krasnovii]|uniref:hypothetical protein n=1 Tax=Bartonella krasnovii TaxID=2267275 RepID=UPI0030C6FD9E
MFLAFLIITFIFTISAKNTNKEVLAEFGKKDILKIMFRFVLCFLFLFFFALYTQEIKKTDNHSSLSPLVANYPLTEDFILKLEKIGKEFQNLFPKPETAKIKNDPPTHKKCIEGYITYISRKPKLVNILRKNNLTLKDFVVGHLALQITLNILTNEEISLQKQNIIPLRNIEFAKKHMYRIIKILRDNC